MIKSTYTQAGQAIVDQNEMMKHVKKYQALAIIEQAKYDKAHEAKLAKLQAMLGGSL